MIYEKKISLSRYYIVHNIHKCLKEQFLYSKKLRFGWLLTSVNKKWIKQNTYELSVVVQDAIRKNNNNSYEIKV